MTVDFFEWKNLCEADRHLNLKQFLKRHADHEIIVIEESIHTWGADPAELRQLCGADAEVEYLGKDSPHWADNDGLYFEIVPKLKKGKEGKPGDPLHVVVYPI